MYIDGMDVRPQVLRQNTHDLSKRIAFQFGPLTVDPPTRSVSVGQRSEMIEPRVMRVLIALADARGSVLSRDDLIADCWDGVIVGDNAVARVISQLRRTIGELAGDRVKVETIARVGFRLLAEEDDSEIPEVLPHLVSPPTQAIPSPRVSRRVLAGRGLAALLAAGAGAYLLKQRPFRHRPDTRAVELARRGQAIFKNAEPGGVRQATALFKQAVTIDPQFAEGWGTLAMMYHHAFQGFSKEDQAAFHQLIDSAARRAIELDPDQPDANMALALNRVTWGRWAQDLEVLREQVRRFPDYWFANAKLGIMLRDVGMIRESLHYSQRVIEIDPMLPLAWRFLAIAQALAGELQQADLTLDQAATRWPAHGALWSARLHVLLWSGRFGEAAAFARDQRSLPDYISPGMAEFYADAAQALKDGNRTAIAKAVDQMRPKLAKDPDSGQQFASLLALMEQKDLALASLQKFVAHANAVPDSAVAPAAVVLFEPPILMLRQDRRYSQLLEASGLEAFWKGSGSQPDFRRS